MRIIPVIDVMGGQAVRAIAGRRDAYRPLVSPLAASSDPCDVAAGYLRLRPFETLYVADLDAILGRGDNAPALRRLAAAFPGVGFWLDSGARDGYSAPNFETVIGSEALPVKTPPDFARATNRILSLDYEGERFLGPPSLPRSPQLWPTRVIVMTLARIGLDAGPDFTALARIKALAQGREVFAAGGLRGPADLAALAEMDLSGALVASALHDGRLGAEELANFR